VANCRRAIFRLAELYASFRQYLEQQQKLNGQ
jgi:hypothetical protein